VIDEADEADLAARGANVRLTGHLRVASLALDRARPR
jgi:hypothetical protein